MTSHHGFSRRLLALASVAAVAIVVAPLGPGSGTAKAAPPSSDPTPARPSGVTAHGSIAVGGRPKLAGGLATLKSGRQQVFVQLAGEGAADAATAVAAEGPANQKAAAMSARTAARDRSAGVFASAHAKDSNARQLFQVGNAVPGFAVDADAAAIEGEPTGW